MDKIWSLMNSFQLVQYIGLFDSHVPANVLSFVSLFTSVTELELLNFEEIIGYWLEIPELKPKSYKFRFNKYDTP